MHGPHELNSLTHTNGMFPISGISSATFQEIARKDALKKDFTNGFTNLFSPNYGPTETYRTSRHQSHTPRASHRSSGQVQPVQLRRHSNHLHNSPPPPPSPLSMPRPSSADYTIRHMKVHHTDMNEPWKHRVSGFVDQHWNPQGPFASLYPMMLRLEREQGPGWRVDKIPKTNFVSPTAVPNSTMNFSFPTRQDQTYSFWRERVPEY